MQQEAENIRNITDHMMSALHSMLTRLRPTEVDEVGLHRSLKKLLQSWNQRSGDATEYRLVVEGNIDNLPDPLPVNLYRIVQESLTNIAKHTAATLALVTLTLNPDKSLHLIIEDNGQTDNSDSHPQMGMGLLGIHERVKALGGEISLSKNPQGGMKIMITMFTAQATETLL
jgi:two-component system sensor histidine kinase UhpB